MCRRLFAQSLFDQLGESCLGEALDPIGEDEAETVGVRVFPAKCRQKSASLPVDPALALLELFAICRARSQQDMLQHVEAALRTGVEGSQTALCQVRDA